MSNSTRCAPRDPLDGPGDDVGQVDRLAHRRRRVLAGQLDEVADQLAELGHLRAYVAEHLGAVGAGQATRASATRWSSWASRSRLVRRLVSGVRSSWPASATSAR